MFRQGSRQLGAMRGWPGRHASTSASAPAPPAGPVTLDTLRNQLRKSDFESYLCGNLLPTSARQSFFVMRALNVELASVRDGARGNPMTGHVRMAFWKDFVAKAYRGEAIAHPLYEPLRQVITDNKHTKRWLDRIIEARDADLDGNAPSRVADMETYAEHTASSLLYLALESVGVRDVQADHAASHIGKAAGLATLLRALPVHSRLGQRYIPDELLAKHGLQEQQLFIQPEEVTTPDGKPIIPADAKKDAGAFGAAVYSATLARGGGGFSSGSGIEMETTQVQVGGKPVSAVASKLAPSAAAPRAGSASSASNSSDERPGGIRLAASPAARRRSAAASAAGSTPGLGAGAQPGTTAAKDAPSARAGPKQDVGIHARGTGPISPGEAAASAALRSGIGASTLVLHKSPEAMDKIKAVTFDIACQARAHLQHARDMQGSVPDAARAALLPAVPVSRFLDRLEAQGFDVYSAGGLGPWQDGRAYARLLLQMDLLKHTIRNTY